jgi:predicted ATPase
VVQRTGGVPFFLVSCAQSLRADPTLWAAADAPGRGGGSPAAALPWDLAQSLRQRVAALPEAAQDLLGLAAVVGREVSPALLTAVTRQPVHAVVAAWRPPSTLACWKKGRGSLARATGSPMM